MTVSTATPEVTYIGNASRTIFPYTFRILETDDLSVYFDSVLQSSGYTVSGVGEDVGGNVTFLVAPGSGVEVLLQRETTRNRTDNYATAAITPTQLNKDFDRTVMMIQEIENEGYVDAQIALLNTLVVHLAGTETITGDKTFTPSQTFTGGLEANDRIIIDEAGDAELFIDAGAASDGILYFQLAGVTQTTITNDDTTGDLTIRTSVGGSPSSHQFIFGSDGTLSVNPSSTNYENLVTSDDDVPNKKYVDNTVATAVAGASWLEPVKVRAQVLFANEAAFPTTGSPFQIDGITINTNDRVLFSNVTTTADRAVYIWDGAAWNEDSDNTRTLGDAVYVQNGTDAGKVYIFDEDDLWSALEVTALSGTPTFFVVENQAPTSAGSPIGGSPVSYTFTLSTAYLPTATGSRLLVFVDGVKYVFGEGYTEDSATQVTLFPPTPFTGTEEIDFYILTPQVAGINLIDVADVIPVGSPQISDNDILVYDVATSSWQPTAQTTSSGSLIDKFVATGSPQQIVFNTTNVTTTAEAGGTAYVQVFLNGVLQLENSAGGSPQDGAFYVSGASQITFNAGVVTDSNVIIYQL